MPPTRFAAVLIVLAAGLVLSGCGKPPRPHIQPDPEPAARAEPRKAIPLAVERPGPEVATLKPLFEPAAPPEPSKAEKYDAALLDALGLLADRKYPQALTALEAARAIQDTEQVR